MKKIICMILSACLLCGCFWSGCNDKENEEGGAVNYVEKKRRDQICYESRLRYGI